jgi:ribosomal protein L29
MFNGLDRNPKSKNAVKTECEAEIKSLKQELSKLKSDLATCQSQMEFGDEDFDPLL